MDASPHFSISHEETSDFDVLAGFLTCLNDAFSNNILTATVPSFKADLRYTNRKFAMKIYLEMYRSGRNENDSKSIWSITRKSHKITRTPQEL